MDKKQLFLQKHTIICKCRFVTLGTIAAAAAKGAATIRDIQRATSAHTGECQGERCHDRILQIIGDFGRAPATANGASVLGTEYNGRPDRPQEKEVAMVAVGEKAPAFSLEETGGTTVSLASLAGKWVVFYFYPKDDTPGCTKEACDFRDHHSVLEDAGAVVYGVSPDPLKAHQKFTTKFNLPFPLLSDPDHTMLEAYGVWQEKSMYGRKYMGVERTTVLIGPDGAVRQVWPKVKVDEHARDVLNTLRKLKGEA